MIVLAGIVIENHAGSAILPATAADYDSRRCRLDPAHRCHQRPRALQCATPTQATSVAGSPSSHHQPVEISGLALPTTMAFSLLCRHVQMTVYRLALLLGLVSDRLLPLASTALAGDAVRWTVASCLVLIGLALAAAGIRNFARSATPVPTNAPTRALVTTGIHGWSRNPIYLGLFLLYGGIGLAVRSPWALMLMLPLAITIRHGVVAREEAYLERQFGDVYRDYKARVRRWL